MRVDASDLRCRVVAFVQVVITSLSLTLQCVVHFVDDMLLVCWLQVPPSKVVLCGFDAGICAFGVVPFEVDVNEACASVCC